MKNYLTQKFRTILFLALIFLAHGEKIVAQNYSFAKSIGGISLEISNGSCVDASGNLFMTGYFYQTVDFDPGAGTQNLTAGDTSDAFIAKYNTSGNYVWAIEIGGKKEDVGIAIGVDALGNIYATGIFKDTVDFDPGPGVQNLISAGGFDIYMAKYDNNGNYLWAKRIGDSSFDEKVNAIKVDASGNFYITAGYYGQFDADPGPAVHSIASGIYLVKYDTNGNFVWLGNMNGISQVNSGNAIAIDTYGNVYVTGYFTGIMDFNPSPGPGNVLNSISGSKDIFITCYTSTGLYGWTKIIGGTTDDIAYDMQIYSWYLYLTGSFMGTADFDPEPGTYNLTSSGAEDIFFGQYLLTGPGLDIFWAKKIGAASIDVGYSIQTDGYNSFWISGTFRNTVDFDAGAGTQNLTTSGQSMFVAGYDVAGNYVSAKGTGGSSVNKPVMNATSGLLYLSGYYTGTVDFDLNAGVQNLTSAGNSDIFFTKYSLACSTTPSSISTNAVNNTICSGGSVTLNRIGGVLAAGGIYKWYSGSCGGTLIGTGDSILVNPTITTSYYLRGEANCGTSTCASVTITVSIPPSTISAAGPTIFCSGGNVMLTASSGAGLTYQWKLDGTSIGGATLNTYSATTSGTYTVVVTNNIGCSSTSTGTLVTVHSTTPLTAWAKGIGGTGSDQGNSIAYDAFGNVYITGSFNGNCDFDPGAGIQNLSSFGQEDIFFAKYDPSGNFLWAKNIGGIYGDVGNSIVIDSLGNVYVTGRFATTVDFDPGPGIYNLTSITGGYFDAFLAKYDANGNFVWAKGMGGSLSDFGTNLIVRTGYVYMVGYYYSTVGDFDPGPGVQNLNNAGASDIFFAKYDFAGNYIWAKSIGGTGNEQCKSAQVTSSGNIVLTGYFSGTADFDPNVSVTTNLISYGASDIFVSNYTSSGNYVWAFHLGSILNEYSEGVALDASGNIYITGQYNLGFDFDPGPATQNLISGNQIFLAKYNSGGNYIWAKSFAQGGSGINKGQYLSLDALGNIYLSGIFRDTADFDPGPGIRNLIVPAIQDFFIAKYDNNGNFLLAKNIIGTNAEYISSMQVDPFGNIYTTGYFLGSPNFKPCEGNLILTGTGGSYDIFYAKFGPNCTLPIANITPQGNTTFCSGGNVQLNATSGTGYSYQWKKNGTSIAGATSSSYVATTTGSYTCTLTNSCGVVTSAAIQVTVSTAVPATPGSITTTGGVVKVCPGESRTYSVVAIAGVTYTWTPCAGSTITSGQNTNSVTVQYNAGFPASDTLRVVATNSCGSSAQRKLKISRNTPGTPGSIIGDGYGVCNLSGKPYSVTNVAGMTYAWSFNTGTATVASGQGTSSITANYAAGFLSGVLSVTAGNGCGTSAARVKTIYAKPATPVSITGATSVCLNQQDVPYSIAPLANVTNYTWTGPTGSHISDGVTTSAGTTLITTATAVTVDFATTAGSVKVRGNNACASGSYKSLAVAIVCREGEFSPSITETRIYPNPASKEFTIETDDVLSPFNVEVFDAYGRLVYSEKSLFSGYQVNTNGWADGLYSVVVRNGISMSTLKLALHK